MSTKKEKNTRRLSQSGKQQSRNIIDYTKIVFDEKRISN